MTTLSNKEIFDRVVDMMKHIESHGTSNLELKFGDFKAMMPMLYESVAEQGGKFELLRLIDMLKRRERIDNKETDFESESKVVGQIYAEEFVNPLVGGKP